MRGAERAFGAIAECWPDAPIYTTLYSEEGTQGCFRDRRVHTSYLQRLGVRQAGFRRLLPLYPAAVESLAVQGHQLLISSSSAFAHGVLPNASARHVCYCYTPFRYAWHERERALREAPRLVRPLLRRTLDRIRSWDLSAAERVTDYIAISEFARERIRNCYGRDATVIYPPVDVDFFAPSEPEDFFLVVGELVPHKRVEVALEAARLAQRQIKVVGEGPEFARLSRTYEDSAQFLGRVPNEDLADLFSRARALVMPNIEEFGITAVEAQAAGRPVLAFDAGGVRETVINGTTGILVPPGGADVLAEAMRDVDFGRFSPQTLREHAEGFSVAAFKKQFVAAVDRLVGKSPA